MFLLSVSLFALVGVSLLLTGAVYLSLSEYMPYHAKAAEMAWEHLGPNFQGLILGLLKGLGSGAFVAGFAILFMVSSSLRRSPRPFVVLMPIVAIGYSTLLCYATYVVHTRTPGDPPLMLTILLVVASLLGSMALALSQRKSPEA